MLTRARQGVLARGQLQTRLLTECTRCLDDVRLELELTFEELFAHPPLAGVELPIGDDGNIDLGPLVRQEALVNVPMVTLCAPDCKGLCPTCGQNLNYGECDCELEQIDPRLSVLASWHGGDAAP